MSRANSSSSSKHWWGHGLDFLHGILPPPPPPLCFSCKRPHAAAADISNLPACRPVFVLLSLRLVLLSLLHNVQVDDVQGDQRKLALVSASPRAHAISISCLKRDSSSWALSATSMMDDKCPQVTFLDSPAHQVRHWSAASLSIPIFNSSLACPCVPASAAPRPPCSQVCRREAPGSLPGSMRPEDLAHASLEQEKRQVRGDIAPARSQLWCC